MIDANAIKTPEAKEVWNIVCVTYMYKILNVSSDMYIISYGDLSVTNLKEKCMTSTLVLC